MTDKPLDVRTLPEHAETRLRARLAVEASGCWTFQGHKVKGKYGRLQMRPLRPLLAHRVAYVLWRGPILESRDVHHKCNNPACCNPDHLELVDHAEHGKLKGEPYFGPGRPLARAGA
jgi:hypothetical protein